MSEYDLRPDLIALGSEHPTWIAEKICFALQWLVQNIFAIVRLVFENITHCLVFISCIPPPFPLKGWWVGRAFKFLTDFS